MKGCRRPGDGASLGAAGDRRIGQDGFLGDDRPHAPLLNITHDSEDTLALDRVLIMDGGRIVEDGSPRELSRSAESRYREMLDAAESVSGGVWSDPNWRMLRFNEGRLHDGAAVDRGQAASC
jgi:hypothetical protein